MLNRLITFLIILSPVEAIASSDAAHSAPGVSSLIYPFINFSLLFGFLFWKLKTPVSEMFTEKSKNIKELAELANEKNRQADSELKTLETKMTSLNMEMKNIVSTAEEDAKRFDKEHGNETQENITRFKQDAEFKLKSEKAELIREINSTLLDEVITGAKTKIKADSQLQEKATSQLMAGF